MLEQESFIPYVGVIKEMFDETPDVKSFRVVGLDGKKLFEHKPGQCAMLIVPGVGESMISITSSPTVQEYQQFSIKKCGCVTSWLHAAKPGTQICVRGPIGNGFAGRGRHAAQRDEGAYHPLLLRMHGHRLGGPRHGPADAGDRRAL